jgi:zinc transporter ZupT
VLRRQDLLELLRTVPEIRRRLQDQLRQHDVADYLESGHGVDPDQVMRWIRIAARELDTGRLRPAFTEDLELRLRALRGAPVAIWLGILLDGIPESLVIGASLVNHEVSLALLAGLLLSNYPEALFSSIGMRQQGFAVTRILVMWASLVLITGAGAAFGSLLFVGRGDEMLSFLEGVAAGSMLTMIAQTMLPDAYIKGGPVIGLVTLTGFLAALFFKNI